MKPSSLFSRALRDGDRRARRMPVIDCNFQAPSSFGFHGGHYASAPTPSFRNISRNYFQHEARHNFIGEAVVFVAMIATSALAIGVGVVTAVHFLHILGYF
jgi:hypothetical protein